MSKILVRIAFLALATTFVFGLVTSVATRAMAQEKVTRKQTKELNRIHVAIDRAGKLYQSRKYDESAAIIGQLQDDLGKLVDGSFQPLIDAARPVHARLEQARTLLVQSGQKVPALKALPPAKLVPGLKKMVSFSNDVAGILNTKCGNCHIRRARGQLSVATFRSLMNGLGGAPVVVPGKSDESRLIEVIVDGEMPKEGPKVTQSELALLKKWVEQGAVFDGQSPDANIAAMAQPNENRRRLRDEDIIRASGTETVSFALDVAPVLVANCNGCHFEPQNIRGGLEVTNFRQLFRGGESGAILTPGDGKNSPLVKRLMSQDRATRMPQGRRALDQKVIDRIITWIDEGARFDGRAGNMNLREVWSIAKAESQTHEQLTAARKRAALKRWEITMSDVKPTVLDSIEFHVLGASEDRQLQKVVRMAESIARDVKRELNIGSKKPLVKGQVSLYVFDRRYDYSEFGKMVEKRDLPKAWRSHWGYDTVHAYAAMLTGRDGLGSDELKTEVTQRIAAVAIASLGADVPTWFANGYGYAITEQLSADKKLSKLWHEQAKSAVQKMERPADFMQNRMPEDASGLIAYSFVKSMMENRKSFQQFLQDVKAGQPFDRAFAAAYSAEPVELVNNLFGVAPKRDRGRNRN